MPAPSPLSLLRGRSGLTAVLAALVLLSGCATGAPAGGLFPGLRRTGPRPARTGSPQVEAPRVSWPADASDTDEDDDPEDDVDEEVAPAGAGAVFVGTPYGPGPRHPVTEGGDAPLEESGASPVGWPDGVGDGRPYTVPMSLDYFQGLLQRVGVPDDVLPADGSALSPEQALELLTHVLDAEGTLGDFARRRMAVHLLLEVATGARPVTREQLHARMERFHRLLVLRPDGYLVRPVTGEAMQKAGEVRLGGDGIPRAGRYEVGPFYAIEDGQLWPVDSELEVPAGAVPLGLYAPDNGVLLPALEGAGQALGDVVGGLLMAVVHPVDALENLARLPGAVRELLLRAPEFREAFLRAPRGERVRFVARLTTHVLLTVGTAGEGVATAASWGNGLSRLSVPVLSLTREGALALRLVAIPGRTVAVAGEALSATYVLHMAAVGVAAAGPGPSWTPPVGGPGQWVPKNEAMSPRSRRFQHKVTKAPAGWVYRVFRNGEKADFDGRDPVMGVLQETKGQGYDKHFDAKLNARQYFKGDKRLVRQALRQSRVANGVPIRWHVAEPRMVDILKKLFKDNGVSGIDVVYTPP